jgi:radical SAM superfamily enzyme YgiQ (UPF0313 family)
MADAPTVLLVQPPYLRLFGSHNNRVPLELHYLHRYLADAGIPSQVLNLDKTEASVSIPWSRLYENSGFIDAFLSGASPLLDEAIERIATIAPDVVVIAGGESLTPWADLGSPYVAAKLSEALRLQGMYTVGTGPFLVKAPGRFTSAFDSMLLGAASPSISQIVRHKPTGEIAGVGMPPTARPLFGTLDHWDIANVIMTTVGCPLTCNFCLGASTGSQSIHVDTVVADIESRSSRSLEIGDAIFPISPARLRDVAPALAGLNREFSCELSVAKCKQPLLDDLRAMGITQIKVGIESGSDLQLGEMGKRQSVLDIENAIGAAQAAGISVTGYVILGGPMAKQRALETLELCERLGLDDLVVNVLSHFDLGTRDFSRDAHWSRFLAEHWGVADVMPRFFPLQATHKAGIGRLLPQGTPS